MKNSMGQFEVVKIDQIVEVENFKKLYQVQSEECEDQLKNSLRSEKQITPVVVTTDFVLLDGYRRLNLLRELSCDQIKVQIIDQEPSIELRVTLTPTDKKQIRISQMRFYKFLDLLIKDRGKEMMVFHITATRSFRKNLTIVGNQTQQFFS